MIGSPLKWSVLENQSKVNLWTSESNQLSVPLVHGRAWKVNQLVKTRAHAIYCIVDNDDIVDDNNNGRRIDHYS